MTAICIWQLLIERSTFNRHKRKNSNYFVYQKFNYLIFYLLQNWLRLDLKGQVKTLSLSVVVCFLIS